MLLCSTHNHTHTHTSHIIYFIHLRFDSTPTVLHLLAQLLLDAIASYSSNSHSNVFLLFKRFFSIMLWYRFGNCLLFMNGNNHSFVAFPFILSHSNEMSFCEEFYTNKVFFFLPFCVPPIVWIVMCDVLLLRGRWGWVGKHPKDIGRRVYRLPCTPPHSSDMRALERKVEREFVELSEWMNECWLLWEHIVCDF